MVAAADVDVVFAAETGALPIVVVFVLVTELPEVTVEELVVIPVLLLTVLTVLVVEGAEVIELPLRQKRTEGRG
jgi:hypothetical protein